MLLLKIILIMVLSIKFEIASDSQMQYEAFKSGMSDGEPNMKTSVTLSAVIALGFVSACASTAASPTATIEPSLAAMSSATDAHFEEDRQSILAMAGDYKVTFDFTETVPLAAGYELKEPKLSGGYESVRVIEDTGEFISLQHILVVGPDDAPFIVKHWRQDWKYEPARVLVFIGGNAWEWRDVSAEERAGAWSQTVYQVDDAPRYGAVARWTYEDGVAEWRPGREWRPLPRRDMTTRDDYHAVDAVNRHAITPFGWVHEQDNTKIVLTNEPTALVREVGVNTYRKFDEYSVQTADDYWAATSEFWAGVRAKWNEIEQTNEHFAITIKGETEDLYNPLLGLANGVQDGVYELDDAIAEAQDVIDSFVTSDIGALEDRLRPSTTITAQAE